MLDYFQNELLILGTGLRLVCRRCTFSCVHMKHVLICKWYWIGLIVVELQGWLIVWWVYVVLVQNDVIDVLGKQLLPFFVDDQILWQIVLDTLETIQKTNSIRVKLKIVKLSRKQESQFGSIDFSYCNFFFWCIQNLGEACQLVVTFMCINLKFLIS